MDIARYLKENGMNARELAERSGVSYQTVYNLMHGKYDPRGSVMKRIIAASGGKIRYEDMVR